MPILLDGQQAALQCDINGQIIISPLSSSNSSITVFQLDSTNLLMEPRQPTASLLNATVVQGTAANLLSQVSQPTASALNATVVQSTGSNLHVNIDNFPGTQPISGTVTANQGTSPWVNNISQFGGSNVATGTGASGAGIPRVTISNDSSLAANQSVNMNQVGGSAVTLGQKVMASSVPVTIASDQSAIPTSATSTGNTPLQFVRNVYSSTNVTTTAYVQLIASTSGAANVIEIFDSSGQTLVIAFGGSGLEVNQFIVFPGGNGRITCKVPASTRISIKALSATANSGEIDINLYT